MIRIAVSFICAGLVLSSTVAGGIAPQPAAGGTSPSASNILTNQRARPDVRLSEVWQTAEIVRVRDAAPSQLSPSDAALQYIESHQNLFRLAAPRQELSVFSDRTDALGQRHVRFRQSHAGLRVWGCETIAHFGNDGTLRLIAGQTIPTPAVAIVPGLGADAAVAEARSHLQESQNVTVSGGATELLLYPDNGQTYLCWLVTFESRRPAYRWLVFVDAHSGEVRHAMDDRQTDGPAVGTGVDELGATRTLQTYQIGSQYYLINTSLPGYTPPLENMQGVYVTDFGYADWEKVWTDGDNVWTGSDSLSQAVSAHANIVLVDEYFRSTHGRQGFDDQNSTVWLQTFIDTSLGTCWWSWGGIDLWPGRSGASLGHPGAVDIIAHEFAHGVTGSSAGLIYEFQSGALNESYSDFFACMVDRDDWLLAEDVRLLPPYFMRNIADPHQGPVPDRYPFGYQPAHMSEYQSAPYGYDYGGVHINSGIPNRAGYLAASAIGREKAEQVWYRALTTYLTPNTGMFQWADLTIQAATDLYGSGSPEELAVRAAMDSVGLVGLYTMTAQVSMSALLGSHFDTSIIFNNISAVPESLLSATVNGPVVSVISPLPIEVPANGSAAVWLRFDAAMIAPCDVLQYFDTLHIETSLPEAGLTRIPITATSNYGNIGFMQFDAGDCTWVGSPWTYVQVMPNTTIPWFGPNYPYCNTIYGASLLLGVIDGDDTTVYCDLYLERSLISIDNFQNFTADFSTGDGRIQGRVRYSPESVQSLCGVVPVEYELFNLCDTTLTVVAGLYLDIDMQIFYGWLDRAGVDRTNKIAWVRSDQNGHAVGLAPGGDTPARQVIVPNAQYVWPTNNLKTGDAYALMVNGTDTAGATVDDYSVLMTFGESTLGPGDTTRYRARLLYSFTGESGLQALANSSRLLAVDDSIICYAVAGDPAGTDTTLAVGFLGWPRTTWAAAKKKPWLELVTSGGQTDVDPLRIHVSAATLGIGRYIDTVTITAPGAVGPKKIIVDLRVNPGTGKLIVPSVDFGSLSSAALVAMDGDTILVGPGSWQLQVQTNCRAFKLIARDGPASTILTQSIVIDTTTAPGLEIAGFTFQNCGLRVQSGREVTVRDNVFTHTGTGWIGSMIALISSGGSILRNVITVADWQQAWASGIFIENQRYGLDSLFGDTVAIASNTCYGTRTGIYVLSNHSRITVRNNIAVNGSTGIVLGPGLTVNRCNNAWNNVTANYVVDSGVMLDPSNLSLDPRFCSDYYLTEASPCAPANNDCHELIGARPVVDGCVYCCVGTVGNIDCDPNQGIDIGDLTMLVDNLFITFAPLCCEQEANVDNGGAVDIGDLTALISYLFITFGTPNACP